jgi:aminoglycoside phosphotransferase (APT) family kinase protein
VDWQRVARTLQQVHALTPAWPQRPAFASSRQLLVEARGGDVDLMAMPAEAMQAVRKCWEPLLVGPECVIHGDLGGGNVLVDGEDVALLDWDESRVDVPWFDFAHLPSEVDLALPVDREALTTAGVAWEAATCWVPEPEYARKRLSELYARLNRRGAS